MGSTSPDDADRAPTIYDVARRAGVAPSTVSRTFARPGRVSTATAQKIRAAAEEIGYRANPIARALTTHRSGMIALVVPDVTNPVNFPVIRGAETTAAEAGYTLVLADSRESGVRERAALDRVTGSVEGVLLTSSRMSDAAVRTLTKHGPVVVLNRAITGIPSVVTDNPRGVRRAMEHLGSLGHHTITYLAGPEASWADGMRWRAVREASLELLLTAHRIGPLVPTVAGGARAVQRWLERPTSAVLAYNDQMAIGFMQGLRERGIVVPDQVSVVGFDNILAADWVSPTLTTVASPLRAMGATAAQHLIAMIGGAKPHAQAPVVLPVRLTVRGSTGPRARS